MVSTEQKYLQDLNILRNVIYAPSAIIVDSGDHKTLFSNIVSIQTLHNDLCRDLLAEF